MTALFALPSAGGALVRTCSAPLLTPVTVFCFALGVTRTETTRSFPFRRQASPRVSTSQRTV